MSLTYRQQSSILWENIVLCLYKPSSFLCYLIVHVNILLNAVQIGRCFGVFFPTCVIQALCFQLQLYLCWVSVFDLPCGEWDQEGGGLADWGRRRPAEKQIKSPPGGNTFLLHFHFSCVVQADLIPFKYLTVNIWTQVFCIISPVLQSDFACQCVMPEFDL